MNRLLGPEEFKFWLFDRRAPLNEVAMATVAGPVSAAQVEAALACLCGRHPALSVRVDASGRPRFVPGAAPPEAPAVIAREGDDHWRRVCEAELARPFPMAQGPLMRVTLLAGPESTDVVFTLAHLLADGIAFLHLFGDLLHALGGGALEPLSEMPPLEELIAEPAAQAFEEPLAHWWSRGLTERFEPGSLGRFVAQLPAVGPTRITPFDLDPARTQALVRRSREEGTTVQGALAAATLLSLSGDEAREIACNHIVSLRGALSPPLGAEMGVYLSRVETRHRVGKSTAFWPLAREVRERLAAGIAHGEAIESTLRTVRALCGGEPVADAVQPAVTVSNVSRIPVAESYGAVKITRVRACACVMMNAPVIAVTTFGGTLTALFNHPANWPRAAEAPALAADLHARLEGACA